MFITRKRYNAEINKTYLDGYNSGLNASILSRFTPNEIRKALGLKPISSIDNIEKINKCETCKNHTLKIDDICIECINGANHYEPYIPKENEQ